jgi:protein TonB
VVQPRYDAAYLRNPPPRYPPISRRLGEQGTTRLRVCVAVDGKPTSVDLQSTSGFDRLDDAARESVRSWTFVPARRGSEPVADCVVVPIRWRLDS